MSPDTLAHLNTERKWEFYHSPLSTQHNKTEHKAFMISWLRHYNAKVLILAVLNGAVAMSLGQ